MFFVTPSHEIFSGAKGDVSFLVSITIAISILKFFFILSLLWSENEWMFEK